MHIYNSDHIVPALLGACLADASYGNKALRLYMYMLCEPHEENVRQGLSAVR